MKTTSRKSALAAAAVSAVVLATSAVAGSREVPRPDPIPIPPRVLAKIPQVAADRIAAIGNSVGATGAAEALSSATPGSPEAIAAVGAIANAVAIQTANGGLAALTPAQSAQAVQALQQIIAATGRTPELEALLEALKG